MAAMRPYLKSLRPLLIVIDTFNIITVIPNLGQYFHDVGISVHQGESQRSTSGTGDRRDVTAGVDESSNYFRLSTDGRHVQRSEVVGVGHAVDSRER